MEQLKKVIEEIDGRLESLGEDEVIDVDNLNLEEAQALTQKYNTEEYLAAADKDKQKEKFYVAIMRLS